MKKALYIITTVTIAAVLLSACNTTVNVNSGTDNKNDITETENKNEQQVGMANPWQECTEEEAYQYAPNGFSAPKGSEKVRWSLCKAAKDTDLPGTMVQLDFDYDGLSFTAREQAVPGEEITDISGMYYDWTDTDEGTLMNWAGGKMPCKFYHYSGEDGDADLCLWFDIETGYAYSLSTVAPDLDGFDIQSVAEAIYDPAKQIGANAPILDITGCYTFTHIVDQKMSPGMGYANVTIGDVDALLVSSGTYDNLDGNNAAIDADVFIYKDAEPFEAGRVCCGGTAYPLAIKDGMLYVAGNHWIYKYTIKGDALEEVEKASEEFDTEGNAKYEGRFEELFAEMEQAQVVDFTVKSDVPAYEYPGPELFYTVLYQYMIDELGQGYPESQVTIPCPVIVAEDESNKQDIKVWGNFWVFNYDLNGDTLECASGGAYPGCIHLESVDDARGYVVTGMDKVEDGSNYDPTAKKIFGKYYDDFTKINSDEKERETLRAQIISNYVYANNLNIKAYKDYGWDPVSLPEENIDNFYSQLD